MKLKIQPEHYQYMKSKIRKALSETSPSSIVYWRNLYLSDNLTEKRFVWDFFYLANLTAFACDTLYSYMNDDHIYSALRRIVKELESELG